MTQPSDKWSPRGSEWHRWDPHLHAPGTLLNDQFRGDWSAYIAHINGSEPPIRALGVTDYFCIGTYKAVRDRYENKELPGVAVLFPNVELRLDIKTEASKPINLHLLFSPEDPNHIAEIERILGHLSYEYKGSTYKCTPDELETLGRAFDPSQQDQRGALIEGAKQFKTTLADLKQLFRTEWWLSKNCLIAVSGRTSDGTSGLQRDDSYASTREEIERFAEVIFAASPSDRDFWLGKKDRFDPAYIENTYGALKPCLHGSDAHHIETVGEPTLNRYCWIKGDLAFESLRQTTLEPERRVWIGSRPPNHNQGPLCVTSVTTYNAPWHRNQQVPLNEGLVAVIGPRGSGKTALVDMIAAGAFAGSDPGDSSFLRRASSPTDLLGDAQVSLAWNNDSATDARLNPNAYFDEWESERVRYLPQHFVDRLCSSAGLASELREEMERVVFAATNPTDRLETNSFEQLANARLVPLHLRRENLKKAIATTSDKIVVEEELHAKLPQLKKQKAQLEAQIKRDKKQKEALIPEGREVRARRLADLEQLYANKEAEIEGLHRRIRKLRDLLAEVRQVQETTEPARLREMIYRYEGTELTAAQWREFVMKFKGDVEAICWSAITGSEKDIQHKRDGDPDHPIKVNETPLAGWPLNTVGTQRDKLKQEVGIDAAKMNRYTELANAIRAQENNLRHIIAEIEKTSTAGERRRQLIDSRRKAYEDVFQTLADEEQVLRDLYSPLDTELSSADGALSKLDFTVKRRVDIDAWVERGEELLDLRKTSLFRGSGSLKTEVEASLLEAWQTGGAEAVEQAMDTFRKKCHPELIKAIPGRVPLEGRAGWVQSIADWLYDTSHISIGYGITYDGAPIEQLSPGTRGIVLLLLYLVIDQQDRRPLIVDQPEENLDPKSVFQELVPRFQEACKRRQVIVVTHNANLVVNTDSDQVIVAESQQTSGTGLPAITYKMGSLENPEIRAKVCDILEGGERAFLERERRYRLRWREGQPPGPPTGR